jgi:DNA invertase Pin-like site-specific DNA recombinase
MRLVGVIRVSRVGGREGATFISPDVQRDQIKAYARAHGHKIVAWQEDLDKPGSTLNRPGIQAALAQVDAGEAEGIIAAKLDRITRSIADLGKLLQRASTDGWNLVAVDVGLDLGMPNGKLVAHVLGAIAEWELDRRRNDWQLARERAVARGVHVASRIPTGYQRGEEGRLAVDEEVAPLIRELFRRRAEGQGWRTLATFLSESGVVTPYGNQTWTAGAVNGIIRNRVYIGEARSGEYVHADAHPAIVTFADWQAAQAPGKMPQARSDDPLMLSGLVRCGSCRYVAKADHMKDRHGDRLGMYRCRGTYASGKCPRPVAILARVLDPIVEKKLLAWLAAQEPTARADKASAELERAAAEARAAEAELLAYVSSETLAIAGRSAFEHGLAARRQRLDEAQNAEAGLRSRIVTIGKLTPADLVDAWPGFTVAEKRELVAAAVDAVVVWPHQSGSLPGDRVRIVPLGEAPVDLPQRGRRVPMAPWPDAPGHLRVAPPEDPDEGLLDRP